MESLDPESLDPEKLQSYYAAVDDEHDEDKCPIKKEDLKNSRILNTCIFIDVYEHKKYEKNVNKMEFLINI